MTIEVLPVGQKCNLDCPYCYEHPLRDAGNYGPKDYDMEAMKAGLSKAITPWDDLNGAFSLFGGEALVMPFVDLAELVRWGTKEFAKNVKKGHTVTSIQTNAVLVEDRHIKLFKECEVSVGASVDGPEECNDSRWAGTLEKTREATEKSMANIHKMVKAGLRVSLIITLWRGNVARERRSKFKAWLKEMHSAGVNGARMHFLEVDHARVGEWELTTDEYLEFLADIYRYTREKLPGWYFDIFADAKHMLLGDDEEVACVWNSCDPYTTNAVHGVNGVGVMTNCGRADHTGVDWEKANQVGFERYLALHAMPLAKGGCNGCRFWLQCKGQCPGTGDNMDWRRKTRHCDVIYGMYEMMEGELLAEGKEPLSLAADREEIERVVLEHYEHGTRIPLHHAIQRRRGGERVTRDSAGNVTHTDAQVLVHADGDLIQTHGDSDIPVAGAGEQIVHQDGDVVETHGDSHGNTPHGDSDNPTAEEHDDHGDAPHGDNPHGDHSDDALGA